MIKKENYQYIALLIQKSIQGKLSIEEREWLSKWLSEDKSHRELYRKLIRLEGFSQWVKISREQEINSNWQNLQEKINKPRRRLLFRVLSYAAIIVTIISVATYLVFIKHTDGLDTPQQTAFIHPGTTKAILYLDNGESVSLDSTSSLTLKEVNGSIIQKSRGTVDYSTSSKNNIPGKPIYNTIRTPRGSEYTVVLSDGTKVFLNSMSSIRYPVQFSKEQRLIELAGEAFFEVKHKDNIPFVVRTNKIDIDVLGTSFNVNAYEDSEQIVTTLVTGIVKVKEQADSDKFVLLKPSEQSIYDLNTSNNEIKTVDVNFFIDWKNGNFSFYNENLDDMMHVLSRWYNIRVEYEDSTLKNLVFSGSMERYETIDKILDIIEATKKVQYSIKNDSTIYFEKSNYFLRNF